MRGISTSEFAGFKLFGGMRGISTSEFARLELLGGMRGISTSEFAGFELFGGMRGISASEFARLELFGGMRGISTSHSAPVRPGGLKSGHARKPTNQLMVCQAQLLDTSEICYTVEDITNKPPLFGSLWIM
ncbi:hypothetical protein A3844_25705 [Paenibacillus helianthi]|uniref:Uncharacterized protein n=1 Tax=Paenibacillus helianthi TaxID=1349432 RepID=A0ABX3EGJ4_9BACL|nr:hypothetical protein [Paenibacillus helianthi]OKP81726.1 hypothetical protein A3844_25705 [Paenibacillus helianthi]